MRVAIKFAYDGTSFHGYQRQPDVRTVEGEIIRCLKKAKIIDNLERSRFGSGSRTDAGVSALGNVLAFDTDFEANRIIPAHNAYSRDVWFHSIAEVDDDFNPRIAKCRWYRYHLRRGESDERLRKAASVFVGEHDFVSFTKAKNNTTRRVDSIDLKQEKDFTVIDIKGRSFLWQMVRRIVAAMDQFERGELDLGTVRDALSGVKSDFGIAPPEPLFLMDVVYDFDFRTETSQLRKLGERVENTLFALKVKKVFLSHLAQQCQR
jgi:tRNA pseudouridine38-40 synthase